MNKEELKDVWNAALENVENDANNYFDDRTIFVNGVELLFGVDCDSGIYYRTRHGADDLVYVKEHPKGRDVKEVLDFEEQFVKRVEDFVNNLNH